MSTPDPVSMCDECAATGVIGGLCLLHAQAEGMRDFVRGVIVWATHAGAGGVVDWSQIGDRARALLRAVEGT